MRKKMDNARRTGPALEKAYQFVLWLLPTVEKFLRGQRLLLGDRVQIPALTIHPIDRRYATIRCWASFHSAQPC